MTQATIVRLEKKLGSEPRLKLHSPRNWYSAMANQLMMEPDKREHLGRWAKGSKIPDLYERTVCVTELAIRNQILEKIDQGWTPCASFEIPKPIEKKATSDLDSLVTESPAGETSVASTASYLSEEVDISKLEE